MVPDVPSVLNRKIITGEIKISPISAAFYALNHKELLLLPDLSISCHGKVMSVILASNYAIENLDGKNVLFSRESASAASFLKMIFNQKNVAPAFKVGDVSDFQTVSQSEDAVLVIGDAALKYPWHKGFQHCFDLGQLWYDMTQHPFVFAVWVTRRSFAARHPDRVKKIHDLLLASKADGYHHIDKVVEAGKNKLNLDEAIIKTYFDRLYCDFDERKIEAMKLFFDSLLDQGMLAERPDVQFFNPR